ncbi:MAG: hypothetical protein GY930_12250 [bacterium]|nr:hypothetical protein [bacterium]
MDVVLVRFLVLVVLLEHLFDEGFLMINTCAAAMATSPRNTEIDTLVAALKNGFAKI